MQSLLSHVTRRRSRHPAAHRVGVVRRDLLHRLDRHRPGRRQRRGDRAGGAQPAAEAAQDGHHPGSGRRGRAARGVDGGDHAVSDGPLSQADRRHSDSVDRVQAAPPGEAEHGGEQGWRGSGRFGRRFG